jgi:hypothetical protein
MSKPKFTVSDKRGNETPPQKPFVPKKEEPVDEIPEAPVYADLNVEMNGTRFLFQDFPLKSKVGSLFIPQMGDVGINKARVVAIGDKCERVKVGDIVFKVAELGEYLMTNLGQFRFLPEDAIVAFDRKFDGEATPIMKVSQVAE